MSVWLIILYGSAAVQALYSAYFWRGLSAIRHAEPVKTPERKEPVSIVICARNEARNLASNLPGILSQRYHDEGGEPLFEVVVVNDGSEDDTGACLERLSRTYPHLHVIEVSDREPRHAPGKKFALTRGVSGAKHDWLLFTDADCRAASGDWLAHMVAPLSQGKQLTLGYSGYDRQGSILNGFIQWETMHTCLQYICCAVNGQPYMAVGRNMACTRDAFERALRHPAWTRLPSGDDDLLVQAAGEGSNTAVVLVPAAYTWSAPQSSWARWFAQKQRHVSTGKYYKPFIRNFLGGYALTHGLFWLAFWVMLATPARACSLAAIGTRLLCFWVLWASMYRRLAIPNAGFLPFWDWGWSAYNFALAPYLLWRNKQKWK